MWSTLLILLSCFLATVYFIIYRKYNYWKKRGIPYLKPTPIVGNYGGYITLQEPIGVNTQRLCQQLDDEPMIGAFFGLEPVLLVQDPELVKTVLQTDFYFFCGREHSAFINKEPLFRNVFNNYGDEWKVLRQNLIPLFSSAKIKNMFYLIESCAKQFEKLLVDEARSGGPLEMRSLGSRYTIDCIISCGFGINSDALVKDNSNNLFKKIADSIHKVSNTRGTKAVFRRIWPTVFYALKLRLFDSRIESFFTEVLKKVFAERQYKPSSRNDLVDAMLGLYNNSVITGDSIECMNGGSGKVTLTVDEEMLMSQCFVFFGTGFDTTATTLNFTLYQLAKHPELQERAIQEVDKYLSSNGNKLEYSMLSSLPFLQCCMDETLRLYPILGTLIREVYWNYRLPNGSTIDAGVKVHIPVMKIHRSPKYFPNPEKFDPDRFSSERKHEIKPYTYLPFGEGHRMCLGIRLAKMIVLSGLVTILSKFRVTPTEKTPATITIEPRWLTTRSRGELGLRLVPRT